MGSLSPNRGGGEGAGGGRGRARALSLSAGLALPAGWRASVDHHKGGMWNVQAGLLSVAAINAIYNVVAQVIGRSSLDPIVFSTYRDFAAAPILFVLALPGVVDRYVGQGPAGQTAAGRGLWPKTRSDLFRMAVQGALGVYANQILFLFGVELTDATTGSVCNLTLPVFAAAIGMCTGRESFRWQTILGLCFCLAGALLMKLEAGPREGGSVLGVSARPPAVPSPTIV